MSLKYAPLVFPFLVASVLFPTPSMAQQVADTLFVPEVAAPAFKGGAGLAARSTKGTTTFIQ